MKIHIIIKMASMFYLIFSYNSYAMNCKDGFQKLCTEKKDSHSLDDTRPSHLSHFTVVWKWHLWWWEKGLTTAEVGKSGLSGSDSLCWLKDRRLWWVGWYVLRLKFGSECIIWTFWMIAINSFKKWNTICENVNSKIICMFSILNHIIHWHKL